jgi:CMP-N,N'-diacetyllegionaminic acid synthase
MSDELGNILGLVLARGGSKGVPGKNLLKMGGISLLGHAIRSAREATTLDRLLLSTEDDALAEEGRTHGAEVPFKRPAELATDTAGTFEVARHAIDWLEKNENWRADVIVILQPTTPFRRGHHIDAVVDRMRETGADAAIALRPVEYPPQWMYGLSENGRAKPFLDGVWPSRRQDAPPVYQSSGMVYVLKVARLDTPIPMNSESLAATVVSQEESVNIDTPVDLALARALWADHAPDWAENDA